MGRGAPTIPGQASSYLPGKPQLRTPTVDGEQQIAHVNCTSSLKLLYLLRGKCKLEKLIQLSELGTDPPGSASDLKFTFCAFYEIVKNTIINETLMYSALCLKVQENIELIVQNTSLCTCHENRDRAWKS